MSGVRLHPRVGCAVAIVNAKFQPQSANGGLGEIVRHGGPLRLGPGRTSESGRLAAALAPGRELAGGEGGPPGFLAFKSIVDQTGLHVGLPCTS